MRRIFCAIIGLMLCSACTSKQAKIPSVEISDQIQSAQNVAQNVSLNLVSTQMAPKNFKISVLIDNPEQKPLTSARTWLSYNPEDLRIIQINTKNSDFNLAAPWEETYDETQGLIKLGRSKTDGTANLRMLQMAEITVEKLATGTTLLDFYDYREDSAGHTSANMILNGAVYNLAKEPAIPALVID